MASDYVDAVYLNDSSIRESLHGVWRFFKEKFLAFSSETSLFLKGVFFYEKQFLTDLWSTV